MDDIMDHHDPRFQVRAAHMLFCEDREGSGRVWTAGCKCGWRGSSTDKDTAIRYLTEHLKGETEPE